jgi:hypothetical protein
MTKKQIKDLEDANASGFRAVRHVIETTEGLPANNSAPVCPPGKNPAAWALGQLGASKGGKARAENLSKSRRKSIAKQAARARWGDKK